MISFHVIEFLQQ